MLGAWFILLFVCTLSTWVIAPPPPPVTDFDTAPIALEDTTPFSHEEWESNLAQILNDDSLWSGEENPLGPLIYEEELPTMNELETDDESPPPPLFRLLKRSRYYRRYPWKRQNGRSRCLTQPVSAQRRSSYQSDARYMCTPTRDDVYQLLLALHDARGGDLGKTVNFCNRKRPASAIFTNIRFLGRRKK